jgi:hypothetical protein
MTDDALPNFIFIGPDKSGSSWLYEVLKAHPDVYVTPAKDVYFFDRYYHWGLEWYRERFRERRDEKVVSEVCHDYLFSPVVADRMYRDLPEVRLMVCLREPIERAFSAYLYLRKFGWTRATFEEEIAANPSLLSRGKYFSHLKPYLERFGRERLLISRFDDLTRNPTEFAASVFRFLGIREIALPDTLRRRSLPAGEARSVRVAKLAKSGAQVLRHLGMPRLLGILKSSAALQHLLFVPYSEQMKPTPAPATRRRLQLEFREEIEALDRTVGTDLAGLWGYR